MLCLDGGVIIRSFSWDREGIFFKLGVSPVQIDHSEDPFFNIASVTASNYGVWVDVVNFLVTLVSKIPESRCELTS